MKVARSLIWVFAPALVALPAISGARALPQTPVGVPLSCVPPLSTDASPGIPVAFSFRGGAGQPVNNAILTVSRRDGSNPATIACDTSQIFTALVPGRYMAMIDMAEGPTKIVDFTVRPGSPSHLVVRFPTMMAGVTIAPGQRARG